jgi:hypothetical protein
MPKPADNTLSINRYLGNPCLHEHLYEDTGKSLRRNNDGACVICSRERNRKWKEKNPNRKNYYNPELVANFPIVISRKQKELFKANCDRLGLKQTRVVRELIRQWNEEQRNSKS